MTTYYMGLFKGKPHVSEHIDETGRYRFVELILDKKEAEKRFRDVIEVTIKEV